jgi:hypothetical protein
MMWLQEETAEAVPTLRSLACVAATEAWSEAPRSRWISSGVSVAVAVAVVDVAAMGTVCHGCVMHRTQSVDARVQGMFKNTGNPEYVFFW